MSKLANGGDQYSNHTRQNCNRAEYTYTKVTYAQ